MSENAFEDLKLCGRCGRAAGQSYNFCSRCGGNAWLPMPEAGWKMWGLKLGQGRLSSVAVWTLGDMIRGVGFFVAQGLIISALFILILLLTEERDRGIFALVLTFFVEGALVASVWLFGVAKYRISWRFLGLWRPPQLGDWALAAGVVLAGVVVQLTYLSILDSLGVDTNRIVPSTFVEEGGAVLVLLSVLALLVAPVAEELFFRGFLFGGLATRYGPKRGALASAGLFSLVHAEPLKFLPLFVLGLLLAWVYYRTGVLWSSIIAHFLNNGIALVVVLLSRYPFGD